MLSIDFIRENPQLVTKKAKEKGVVIDVKRLLEVDEYRRDHIRVIDDHRNAINVHTKDLQHKPPSESERATIKDIKEKLKHEEDQLSEYNDEYHEILNKIPNIFPDDTPLGGEEANKPIKHHGTAEKKDVKDHLSWGEAKGYLDFERGAKVAGAKFYYTKGPLVELELACIQLAMSIALKHGFTPITVPHMVNEKTANGTGFSPKGEEDQIYTIEGEDLSLIATAEIPITGYHAGEILEAKDLPLLYVGLSPAYRKEAGAYGKHSKGLFRVHQFNKVEMYVFCKPEESSKWHDKLVEIEEELCTSLEIPYQMVRIAAGDLGAPAYKKFDIEYWSPVEGIYRELMSCSNVTDYQARRLKIRYRNEEGKPELVHTLNGTAMAFSRIAIALIENHQDKSGDVAIPRALQSYMSKDKI